MDKPFNNPEKLFVEGVNTIETIIRELDTEAVKIFDIVKTLSDPKNQRVFSIDLTSLKRQKEEIELLGHMRETVSSIVNVMHKNIKHAEFIHKDELHIISKYLEFVKID